MTRWRRARRRSAALGAALLTAALLPLRAQAAVCDPHAAALDRVRQQLLGLHFEDAIAPLNAVLAGDPSDFRANYQLGLVYLDIADRDDPDRHVLTKNFNQGIQILIRTAQRLPQVDPVCARTKNLNAIMSAIGIEYLRRYRYDDAQKYLLQAYALRGQTGDDVNRITLEGLGQVSLALKNFVDAHTYYAQAIALGSAPAAAQIRIADSLGGSGATPDPKLVKLATTPDRSGKNSHWLRDPRSGCWVFDRYPTDKETVAWSGACSADQLASGPGTAAFSVAGKLQESWTGTFAAGSLNGPGVARLANGRSYSGDWAYSVYRGFGTLALPSGDTLEGYWPGAARYTSLRDKHTCAVAIAPADKGGRFQPVPEQTCIAGIKFALSQI